MNGNGSTEVDMFKKLGLFFLVFASVLSCMSPVVENPEAKKSVTGALEIIISEGARTILPSYANKVMSYQVILKTGASIVANESFIKGEAMKLSNIPVGAYTLEVLGKNNEDQNIVQGSTSVNVQKSGSAANVTLGGILSGFGSLDLTLDFPSAAGVESAQVSLVPLGEVLNMQATNVTGSVVSIIRPSLAAGYYDFYAELSSGGEVVAKIFETVWIYGNISTDKVLEIAIGAIQNPPAGPENFIGNYNGSDAVVLSWTDISSTEENYLLTVSVDGGAYQDLVTLPANTEQYLDTEIAPNTTRSYRLFATNGFGDSAPSAVEVEIPGGGTDKVATPVINPNGGSISDTKTISLATTTSGANIYYTTDGSTPDATKTPYTAPFTLEEGQDQTVRAIAYRSGWLDSNIAQATFDVEGSFTDGIKVYVKGYSDIYYWATEPSGLMPEVTWEASPALTDEGDGVMSFMFPDVTYTKLIFKTPGQTKDLEITSGEWWYDGTNWQDENIFGPVVPEVSIEPNGGIFAQSSLEITLDSSNSKDTIYYTTDGSEPGAGSIEYTLPFTISGEKTVKAIAQNELGEWGSVTAASFDVKADNDIIPPSISSSIPAGSYLDPQSVSFSVTDNNPGVKAYYTLDNTEPNTGSPVYNGANINITERSYVWILAVDAQGNETTKKFFFNIGSPARSDFRSETIYFLLPTRFYDGDPSNNVHSWDDISYFNHAPDEMSWVGDIKGLIEKLDYIKALGFSAIWITPPVKNASGYDYHGYHALDMTEIDPRLSSANWPNADAAYQELIDEVHARDMKLIQDIVLNHTGNFGEENLLPLFKQDAEGNYIGKEEGPESMEANAYLDSVAQSVYGDSYANLIPGNQYGSRIAAMKEDQFDTQHIYHHEKTVSWNGYTIQTGQIAGDCVDLNTENPIVQDYLIDAYNRYIDMGVDGFRVDTVKHISRLMFNKVYIPAFKDRGGEDFFIFGENAARYWGRWSEGVPAISPSFYSWNEDDPTWVGWSNGDRLHNEAAAESHFNQYSSGFNPPVSGTPNHKLNGNNYHTPDWSLRSGLDQIDFPMHWAFRDAGGAWGVAMSFDDDFNDATWNVTYVDSHDYAPDNNPESVRYNQSDAALAENFTLLWTFRGIPTIYYGSEVRFQAGVTIDGGAERIPIESTGRAYFGNNLTGSVNVSDFGVFSNATGAMSDTLNHPMAQHLITLNRIRRAVPALQRGQYSTSDIAGGMSFKRRFTSAEEGIDSFVLVTVRGSATFNNIPNGTYVDAVTGDTINVSGGSLTVNVSGQGNARVYVLDTTETPAPGKVGNGSNWLQ
jgi:glycosidase